MNPIDLLRATRKNTLNLCANLSEEQLNFIPEGFNNNLIWNAGHVIATMELLTYGLAGHHTPSHREFINRYRKGTKPEEIVGTTDIAAIIGRLSTSVEQLEKDLHGKDFSEFKEYQTSYGVVLHTIEDALVFNNAHEAMHIGSMLALRKFV